MPAISCDPEDLLEASKCYRCVPPGLNTAIITSLICQWADASGCQTPSAPTALDAKNIADTSFRAFWTLVVGDGYMIEVSSDVNFLAILPGYPFTVLGDIHTDIIVVGFTPNTTYYYRLRAFNACGDSANSNVIQVTTLP